MDLIKGNTLIAQANTQPVSNISTAILLLVALVGLWLLLKLFIRIILVVISLATSALQELFSHHCGTICGDTLLEAWH